MPAEGRGLSSRPTQQVARDRGLGNLTNPKRVQKLQMALHAQAKTEADYRFYARYGGVRGDEIRRHTDAQGGGSKGAVASKRRHTRLQGDWSSDVCSSD